MPDSLDLFLDRECILAGGAPGVGKSRSVAELIKTGEETGFNVVLIDFDGGIRKAIRSVIGHLPENLDYFLANDWSKCGEGVAHAKKVLGPRDWLVFEAVGTMWEKAASYFSQEFFEEDAGDHLVSRRKEAEVKIREAKAQGKPLDESRERMRATGFKGLDAGAWQTIKERHNELRDGVVVFGNFNVLGTTSMSSLDEAEAHKWPLFSAYGRRPEGEKNNVHKYETFIGVESKGGKYLWRTDLGGKGKDRERELVRDIDFTGTGFIQSYYEYFGLEL